MKNIIFIISVCVLLFSCSSYKESNILNIKKADLAREKFINWSSDFSFEEYKSLIVEYAKNSEFPDIKN
tara:strand:+ start:549 stop:755 length:207 start_codon:yes stop_codon:yes gene_type:complete